MQFGGTSTAYGSPKNGAWCHRLKNNIAVRIKLVIQVSFCLLLFFISHFIFNF